MLSRECCNLIRNSFSTFSFLVLLLTLTETEKEGGSRRGSLLSWSDFDFVCAIDTFKRKWRQSDTNTGSDEKKCKENPEKKLNFRWKFWKEKQKEENGILGNLQRRKGEVSLFINEPNVDTRPTEPLIFNPTHVRVHVPDPSIRIPRVHIEHWTPTGMTRRRGKRTERDDKVQTGTLAEF